MTESFDSFLIKMTLYFKLYWTCFVHFQLRKNMVTICLYNLWFLRFISNNFLQWNLSFYPFLWAHSPFPSSKRFFEQSLRKLLIIETWLSINTSLFSLYNLPKLLTFVGAIVYSCTCSTLYDLSSFWCLHTTGLFNWYFFLLHRFLFCCTVANFFQTLIHYWFKIFFENDDTFN